MAFDHAEEHVDEDLVMVQANIDDMNPEQCAFVLERLFSLGVNDAYWTSILMKKGRPGLMLSVLASTHLLETVKREIFMHTTTLGLRYFPVACHRLGRRLVPVETTWGTVHVKVGTHRGEDVQFSPEYAQCEELARRHNIPVARVYDEAKAEYLRLYVKRK